MNHNRDQGGFTLIELLIVLIILSILAGIVVYAVGTTGSNASYAACTSDAKTFETALESYKAEVGYFPGAAALSTNNQPNVGNGQVWANATSSGVFGLLGNDGFSASDVLSGTDPFVSASAPNASPSPQGGWTFQGNISVGPFMRQLSSTTNYQIVTDGQGGVFVYPPGPTPDTGYNAMDHETVNGVKGDGDPEILNFDTNPAICSDQNVVS